jgi:YidC/Oxa1 family membrane protein insertase
MQAMNAVDSRLEQTLEYGWLAPISKGLLYLLNWIYKATHNYGWAIVILTLLITLILLPFNLKKPKNASSSMEMLKKLQYVEQKYKHDPELLAEERKKIYDKYGLMPGFSSFLPMLIQAPIFLGLNRILSNAIELYQAPFIKGWIDDLSVKDPYYILPVIIGGAILASTASKGDIRQRVVMVFVSIMVAYLFSNFPAGLALYVAVNLVMGFVKSSLQR